ncbi:group I truncated hemoglobin [Staphylospora marina]|uniref:group I truncated hemoglobin n=1 Tax=Staphylospora marina TaxID=2490858 RepID=UPI000F5BD077|nr:group 1 truncated hemoglobin [Staphylospora marina]
MNTHQQSLFGRLGGKKETIEALVEAFYQRVLADDTLKGLFVNTDMVRQKRHMTAFLVFALGGPNEYKGKGMREAHAHLNITEAQFASVAGHLVDTLKSFDVQEEYINAIIEKVASLKPEVVAD